MSGENAVAGLLERSEHCSSVSSADPIASWDDQWGNWDEVEDDSDPGGWGDVMEGDEASS